MKILAVLTESWVQAVPMGPLTRERGSLKGVGGDREEDREGRLDDRRTKETDRERDRSLSPQWTRIAAVESSCSKESCGVPEGRLD